MGMKVMKCCRVSMLLMVMAVWAGCAPKKPEPVKKSEAEKKSEPAAVPGEASEDLEQRVIEALQTVFDPEALGCPITSVSSWG